jgi:outer membrane immunogenic protein
MKKWLFAFVAFGALAGPSLAADMSAPAYKAPLPPPPPLWSWTGFYIGANAGWIGSSSNAITNTGSDTGALGLGSALGAGVIPGSIGLSDSGFIGGGQVGYNWQVAPSWVLGIEADFDGTTAKSSTVAVFPGGGGIVPLTTTYSRELDTLGTVRGRVGFLSSPGLLWYGTGGLAYGETKIGSGFACATCAPPAATGSQSSNTPVGWTVGAGVEWKFAPSWSVKAEYLYVDLGNQSNTISYNYPTGASTLTSNVNERDNIVRFGINYMFH